VRYVADIWDDHQLGAGNGVGDIGRGFRRGVRLSRDGWGLSMHQDDSPVREHYEQAKTAEEILPGIHRFCHLAGDEEFSVVMIYAFLG
jgi:hypothetical protein